MLAGKKGCWREVKYVTVMEVPDAIKWLKGHDLLLTSLYPIKDDSKAIRNLVKNLHEKGSAALAIKTRQFFDEIPEVIIEEAERLDFPVIEIKPDISYIDIMTPLVEVILREDRGQSDETDELLKVMAELAFEGEGIDLIISTLSKILKNEVTVESDLPLITQTEAERIEPFNARQMNELRKSRRPIRMVRKKGSRKIPCIVSPVILNKTMHGFVTCWETNRPFGKKDFLIMERLIPIFALEFLKVKTKIDVEQNYKDQFFSELLEGKNFNEDELKEKGAVHGWDFSLDYQAIVLNIDKFKNIVKDLQHDELQIQEFKHQLRIKADKILKEMESRSIVLARSDQIVILFPVEEASNDEIKEQIATIRSRLIDTFDGITFTIGVGRFHKGIKGLQRGYWEAVQAIQLGRRVYGRNSLIYFDNLGIYRILSQFPDMKEMENIYRETVEKLVRYDEEHDVHLMETLTMFLDCNANQVETAEKMYIHVNTLKYRLQKIEQITGYKLNDTEGRFYLQLGLKIKDIMDQKGR